MSIPLGELLLYRGWASDPLCSFCHAHIETSTLLFISCEFVRPIWYASELGRLISQHFSSPAAFWLGYTGWWVHNPSMTKQQNIFVLIA